MGISRTKNESTLVCGVVVGLTLIAALAGCGDNASSSDAASTTKPSATASVTADSPEPEKTVSPEPEKVTLSLGEIADTPGTFREFKEFVAKHGTAEQKTAVKHLKGWRGYERKLAYPALEAGSDYPTINYEAIEDGDQVEQDKMLDLEKQGQYIAEAFAAWWEIDETAVLQVYDRSGEYAAGTSCIRPDTVEKEGSCL
ncbi:hypothetical protein OH809_42885 [Streptomyces sp. NBC_00873]|uniref:hypothetical protein n=1 Tax=unclassified Streptomyces TaxID=2593676 RepID=UPI003867D652|nr:hypothetical protein OH809_00825 [Streptomyces sp. NBC_00873]WSY96799.1 hypothetical protein OH809_42885 [Streptomyces sp. NBC_00873]WTA41428.1 hypothetical protein OH821_00825 [Streptomyces sp. NBC_00842]WTA48469.1 hypothetical protein OH821_42990 [Streptomyces sp. NBC_00842]